MNTLNALACNGLEQLADGVWQRHSRFSQAVNFVHADGALLTLFRYGKGMGPTGILLSSTQFAQLANLPRLVKQGRLLWGRESPFARVGRSNFAFRSATRFLSIFRLIHVRADFASRSINR
ncbi:hypothetical protein ACFW0Z_003317 [Klebsiella aerogenes]